MHSGTLKVDMSYEKALHRDIEDITAIANYSHTDWQRTPVYRQPRFQLFYTDNVEKLSETFQVYNVSYCIESID